MTEKVKTPPPGIYPGISFEEYVAWEAINNSVLSVIRKTTPAHAKIFMEEPPDTAALRVGHALHTLVLEPGQFADRYAVRPACDRRTNKGKAIYEEFMADLGDKSELTTSEVGDIMAMAANLRKKGFVRNYVERGQAEVCIVWKDERTGLLCKARLDYYQKTLKAIIDLKTTIKTAGPSDVSRAIANFDYHQQAAWYSDGLATLIGEPPDFVFLFMEKKPPYECRAWQADDDTLIAGRRLYRKALNTYAECVKTGVWGGWPDTVDMISLPQWALNEAGAGKYNLITREEQENGNETEGQQIDWDQLGREATESELAEGRI